MKNILFLNILSGLMLTACVSNKAISSEPISKNEVAVNSTSEENKTPTNNGNYTLIVEGFDWGAAASKVILSIDEQVKKVNGADFEVLVKRSTECAELSPEDASGALKVLYAYISDDKGKRVEKGKYITLALYVAPFETLNSPVKYFGENPKCPGNQWINFDLTIKNKITNDIWNKETNRIIPLIDDFDLTGRFAHKDKTLSYASFIPKSTETKRPLIIWLHGGGEGGADPSIPLIANRAANYAAPEIQAYFNGAYVLVPQAPTFWMDKGNRQYTTGEVNDIYNESLMALIKDFVKNNSQIDENRIYVGGCSNGGYMTLKLMLLHPEYFAAGFPSALAFQSKNLTDEDIQRIKDLPIWFIHSQDDPVTKADETATPIYQQLIKAGAENVHYSLFDHVTDITNQFGGADFHYLGHFSWIYSHTNKCQLDYDGKPVMLDGQPVTLMGWLARQTRMTK